MLMLVRPRMDAEHKAVYESKWIEPSEIPLHEYNDMFGNICWRFVAPPGLTTVRYDAVVEIPETADPVMPDALLHRVEDIPDDAIVFTLPSRYVESDQLLDDAWNMFGATPPTWARIQAVCDWVHNNIEFKNGSSTPSTTALDIYKQRAGVCRDFALLAVAFCRALNIPTRYCTGYISDIGTPKPWSAMDFAAWMEVYLGGRWHAFDPRNNAPRIGRTLIAYGRDAADVPLTHIFGPGVLSGFKVWTDEAVE